MPATVYFSSASNTTARFVDRLGIEAHRIPLRASEPPLLVSEPYVLVVPTYGGGNDRGAVPKQVAAFLNNPANRALLAGVIAAGNTNFGAAYCRAGAVIAAKCGIPYLYRFELLGTAEDVTAVCDGLTRFWA